MQRGRSGRGQSANDSSDPVRADCVAIQSNTIQWHENRASSVPSTPPPHVAPGKLEVQSTRQISHALSIESEASMSVCASLPTSLSLHACACVLYVCMHVYMDVERQEGRQAGR